jgi:hypothetical protein
MRQALFIVLMLAAAFLGGAVVNGPGVRWIQARIIDYMGVKDGGEIASVDLAQGASSSAPTVHPQGPSPGDQVGQSGNPRIGHLRAEAESNQQVTAGANLASRAQNPLANERTGEASQHFDERTDGSPASVIRQLSQQDYAGAVHSTTSLPTPGVTSLVRGQAASDRSPRNSSKPSGDHGGSPPATTLQPPLQPPLESHAENGRRTEDESEKAPAPLDPSVGSALLASFSPRNTGEQHPADRPRTAAIPLEVAPARLSPSPPSSVPSSTQSGQSGFGRGEEQVREWKMLRRKLQSLGVTRYSIEGRPNGQAVFSGLIPVAGRQAVSQCFEAEGEDEFEAARAVVKRITLWRATRPSSDATR